MQPKGVNYRVEMFDAEKRRWKYVAKVSEKGKAYESAKKKAVKDNVLTRVQPEFVY